MACQQFYVTQLCHRASALTMEIHRTNLGEKHGASVAMGNFDGLHLGHQAVIDLARPTQTLTDAPLGVVTFEPHPRQFFTPDAAPFRLMNAEARANRLAKLGVRHLYELPFDKALAGLSPEEFARDILAAHLGISHVVVGADFRFGKGRAGTAADLQALGLQHGFRTTIATLVQLKGQDISSTAIRDALSDGRPRDAAAMLGHWHRIEGEVIHGEKRGRELGFPTANMDVTGLHLPKQGVYAVRVDVLSGPQAGQYIGAASLGVRPMFGTNSPNLESHLFDFEGDLYGHHLSVALVEYLRPEVKFTTLPALMDQMRADCDQARAILSAP
jgi:riboflavin kinase / FMN adenylyltransferase